MILLITILACLVVASLCYAFTSMTATLGNRVLGSCKSGKPSRLDIKQQEVQELLKWADELQQQAQQLQRETASWRREP